MIDEILENVAEFCAKGLVANSVRAGDSFMVVSETRPVPGLCRDSGERRECGLVEHAEGERL